MIFPLSFCPFAFGAVQTKQKGVWGGVKTSFELFSGSPWLLTNANPRQAQNPEVHISLAPTPNDLHNESKKWERTPASIPSRILAVAGESHQPSAGEKLHTPKKEWKRKNRSSPFELPRPFLLMSGFSFWLFPSLVEGANTSRTLNTQQTTRQQMFRRSPGSCYTCYSPALSLYLGQKKATSSSPHALSQLFYPDTLFLAVPYGRNRSSL